MLTEQNKQELSLTYLMLVCARGSDKKKKKAQRNLIHNYAWHNTATVYFRTKAMQDKVITVTLEMQSGVQCPQAVLFVPRDHLKRLCLLLVLQNKQRQAELEQWLEKSTNPQQDMSTCASRPDQVLWKGWVNEVKGWRMNVRGVVGEQRCELRADRAASLNLVYHIRHGNITSIFFSLWDQSLRNPSKQQWNNSLFALCGLGPHDPLCCCSQRLAKVETIYSLIVKLNFPRAALLIFFFSASLLGHLTGALLTSNAHDAANKWNLGKFNNLGDECNDCDL